MFFLCDPKKILSLQISLSAPISYTKVGTCRKLLNIQETF